MEYYIRSVNEFEEMHQAYEEFFNDSLNLTKENKNLKKDLKKGN